MTKDKLPFILLLGMGEVYADDIDDYIDQWHAGFHEDNEQTLHDFLGMTWEEYAGWVEQKTDLSVAAERATREYVTTTLREQFDSLIANKDCSPMANVTSVAAVKGMLCSTLAKQGYALNEMVLFCRMNPNDPTELQSFYGSKQQMKAVTWTSKPKKVDGKQRRYRITSFLEKTEEVVLREEIFRPTDEVWEPTHLAKIESVYELSSLYTQDPVKVRWITATYTVDPAFWGNDSTEEKNDDS